MFIGSLRVTLSIRNALSLKEKRQVLKSLKDRIQNKFNVAVAEIDKQDIWQTTVLGLVTVSNDTKFIDTLLSQIINFLRAERATDLVSYEQEIL